MIRVPRNLDRNFSDHDELGLSAIGPHDTHGANTSTMSMYASALNDEQEPGTVRKSSLPKSKLLGLADAKRSMIKRHFMVGDMHDGNLDDLVIRGSNVLESEISHAKSIPANERVMIRKESSLFEL